MKNFLFLVILLISAQFVSAQGFKHAVGIRAGMSSGFEYRIYTDDANSYKFLLSTRANDQGLQFHVFKEFHKWDMFNFTDRLVFLYGVGIHAGYERWDEVHYQNNTRWYNTRTAPIVGLDGLAGLEYVFHQTPVSIGFEVKPYFDFLGRDFFDLELFDFAFTVKYLF
jgi:hypothetical protein